MNSTPRILVTGGAGYLGAILVPALLARGCAVTVVDNFMYGQTPLLDCCADDKLTIIRGDVRDERLMLPLLKKADVIMPLACLVGAPLCAQKSAEARAINLDAILLLLKNAAKSQRFISPTTNSGYGVGQAGVFCTEETPMNPISLYGVLKVELEQALLAAGAVSLRLATVCGISPRMRLDLLVNDFTYRAVTDRFVVLFEAHFKRNYIHVRDVARAFLHALDHFDAMRGQPYNVGLSDANLSKLELCQEIQKQVPDFTIMEAPIGKDPDQRNYIVSNAKIEATGYRPQVSIQRAIAELIKGYQIIRRNQHANV
ncbi:MAG TPA: SDR family oxidoreductase [Kiritimatiellia bacterium]|jgi:nucleoside-diphosphate-sugar epimerase|nr:MAG: UDP-glucose 4-epimerase [Verrucomicrobia bacterium ADurb.Bin018]HOU59748.1 SDR family oxidoreductase [Kiritimatiellia bacterium]HPV47521.1 SDR family oxidoreductase [Kiritimatiellia bacterium]HPY62681.1 SDR family oxidoreductase [Kiritimatiellia bacterium]HQF20046.1 SDR family oxidoreductase [Kiritimatiellia bacterium]